MKEKREVRYYRIRAGVFWAMIIIIVGLGLLVCGVMRNAEPVNKENSNGLKQHTEYGNIESTLETVEECYLCGNSANSLMGYYRKFDTIGVIGLNEWHVLDLGLKKYDSEGILEADQAGSSSMFGNTQGLNYSVDSMPSRGMARATISSENGMFNETVVKQHLCQECLDKVTNTLEGYFEDGKEEYLPFCVVDFETLEIYPVQKQNVSYFVRDYWVTLECGEEIEIEVYYLPER